MARTLFDNVRIGMLVYEPFCPAHVGIVVSMTKMNERTYGGSPHYSLGVRWFKKGKLGEPVTCDSWHLNDYEALTEDHERKAAKFRGVCTAIKAAQKLLS